MSVFSEARRRAGSRLVLLLLVAAFSFSAMLTLAFANHYHTYNGVGHGFVHGDSTTDGSFFSRIESHPSGSTGFWSHCRLYANFGTLIGDEEEPYGQSCNPWSGGTGYWTEANAYAFVHSYDTPGDLIPSHNHFPH